MIRKCSQCGRVAVTEPVPGKLVMRDDHGVMWAMPHDPLLQQVDTIRKEVCPGCQAKEEEARQAEQAAAQATTIATVRQLIKKHGDRVRVLFNELEAEATKAMQDAMTPSS